MRPGRLRSTLITQAARPGRPGPVQATGWLNQSRRGEMEKSATMASRSTPSDTEIGGFLGRLNENRTTLSEGDRAPLCPMLLAGSGTKDERDRSTKPLSVAVNPRGPAGGPGYWV